MPSGRARRWRRVNWNSRGEITKAGPGRPFHQNRHIVTNRTPRQLLEAFAHRGDHLLASRRRKASFEPDDNPVNRLELTLRIHHRHAPPCEGHGSNS